MKAFVNEGCIGCGLCVSTCPEVFHMTDSGVAEAAEKVPTEQEELAKEARDNCPVSVIDVK